MHEARPGAGGESATAGEALHEARLAETAARLREERRADEAAAPRTHLLDPTDLTEEELRPTERQDYFMPRSSTGPSGERAAAKAMAERRKQWRASASATAGGPATRRAARKRAGEGEAPDVVTDDRDDAGAAHPSPASTFVCVACNARLKHRICCLVQVSPCVQTATTTKSALRRWTSTGRRRATPP